MIKKKTMPEIRPIINLSVLSGIPLLDIRSAIVVSCVKWWGYISPMQGSDRSVQGLIDIPISAIIVSASHHQLTPILAHDSRFTAIKNKVNIYFPV